MNANWALALVLVGGVACTSPNSSKACLSGTCSNPDFPYCDAEGVISGEPGTCIAVTCTPGAVETCLGDDALTCNTTGDGYEHVHCDLGCGTAPKPHCKYIEPRYTPEACDAPAVDDSFIVSNSAMLDPNLDSSCNGGIVPQQGAPPICVVRYRRIAITPEGTLKIIGNSESGNAETAGRSIAFVVDDELTIEGVLDVSADGPVNGPGGGLVISGGKPELVSPGAHKGGGGAGGKTAGAAGGAVEDGGGSTGGLPAADPALLAVLTGGAAAGRAANGAMFNSGGGGGAATLVSCAGAVTVTGTIDAGGGGGWGGYDLFGGAVPAFGGGAGGYIVVQAKTISITGYVFANGGGGGTGTQANLTVGANGYDGLRSATTGAPGNGGVNGGGRGGTGGVGTTPPTVGGKPTTTGASSGGGGGSVGFLQTYTPDGVEPMLMPAAVSPRFQPNITSKTR